MHDRLDHINQDIKGDKARIRTQQYMQLYIGAKEIQQVNPSGPDNSQKHQPPTITSIDKSLSGTVKDSEFQPTGMQSKRKSKLPTVIGLTTKSVAIH